MRGYMFPYIAGDIIIEQFLRKFTTSLGANHEIKRQITNSKLLLTFASNRSAQTFLRVV